ncbi:MAG: hypothetical protein AAFU33_00110 [Bacteroidota bacterium]
MPQKTLHSPLKSRPLIIGLGISLMFVLAAIFPNTWWGIHYLAFVSRGEMVIFMGIVLALQLYGYFEKGTYSGGSRVWDLKWLSLIWAGVMWGICHLIPIIDDNYGNVFTRTEALNATVSSFPSSIWSSLFSLNVKLGAGRDFIFEIVGVLAYYRGGSVQENYHILVALGGAFWVGMLWWFVPKFLKTPHMRWLAFIMGISLAMMQVFMGHAESYGLVLPILGWWLMLMLRYIQTSRIGYLWSLLPLGWLILKLHNFGILLLPVLALVLLYHWGKNKLFVQRIFSLSGMLWWVYLPMVVMGLIGYFFVFEDHVDARDMLDFEDIDRLFLPLFSPDPPLDRYNLLSWNHIQDYLNIWLMISPVGLLILGTAIGQYRKQIDWNRPEIVLTLLSVLIMASILFMINPLLSMPMDWDVFCFLCPVLFIWILSVLRQMEEIQPKFVSLFSAVGLALFLLPMLLVNADKQSHADRLTNVGMHINRTYWAQSARYILYSLVIREEPVEEYLRRKEEILEELKPYAFKGNDRQYAELLLDQAVTHFQAQRNPMDALPYYEASDSYQTLDSPYLLELMEVYFVLGKYEQAHNQALKLLERGYPAQDRALKIAMHTALEAGRYGQARQHSEAFLALDPDDQISQVISQRLNENDRVDSLKYLFRRGE